MKFLEAQEESKSFHYAWLLLSIVLVAWRLPEASLFPSHKEYFPEVAQFASLWSIKDLTRIKESKILWIMMEMDLHILIIQRPRLSPTLFSQFTTYAKFKADFHNVSIRARKEPKHTWHKFPYFLSEMYV